MTLVRLICAAAALVHLTASASPASTPTEDPYARAVRLVGLMTQDEKFGLIQQSGTVHHTKGYTGCLPAVPRLGIPETRMNDGPQGFRGPAGTSTQWPSGLTVAHSWDRALFRAWGEALGAEFAGKGANVMFGPGLNVQRLPNGGRSFEYGSGEDPFLGHELVQGEVAGIQAQGVVANAKHFIANDQEGYVRGAGDRHYTSEVLDERTLMELYFPPFEGALKAGVLSVMCANNLVNGVYVCENNRTGNWLLREHGGFKGWMCSDYDGTRSTIDAANHGLDIAMPGPPHRPDYFGAPLRKALANGDVAQATIDEKATRVVYSLAAVGALDVPKNGTAATDVTSDVHRALARRLATAGATLLQNEGGLLPLDLAKLKRGAVGSVAVIGAAAAGGGAIYGGGGSGAVVPKAPVSVLDALLARFGQTPSPAAANCTVADKGTDYFASGGKKSKKMALAKGSSVATCCAACNSDKGSGWARFTFDQADAGKASAGCWCHPGGAFTTKRHPGYDSGVCGAAPAAPGPVVFADGSDVAAAAQLAAQAAVVIVVIAQTSHEGQDRTTLALDQDALAAAVARAAGPGKTIVITVTPGPFLTAWRNDTGAILDLGFAGEQEGEAAADVLFGAANPAGKLPHTLPNAWNETAMAVRQYPGIAPNLAKGEVACSSKPTAPTADGHNPAGGTGAAPCVPYEAHYDEKLQIGYRWYDAHGVAPAFPFGHGLSYTSFTYADLAVSKSAVRFTVTNTGAVPGAEVAQLYLGFPAAAGEPPRQLKGFEKTAVLAPGASQTVTLVLDARSFSIWDVAQSAWSVVPGDFKVTVGSSSRDARLHATVTV